jgi:glyoxylase-like metal-dependent hydrolase (beta-lactamase superfamily II)
LEATRYDGDRGEGDRVLEELGLFRIPVPVPFPQAGGPVNVIVALEEGGGLAFLDSGLGTEEAEEALREGLAARGFAFADARRIVLTHGHVDHYGLAQTIHEASGASVAVHPADRRKVAVPDHLRGPEYRAFVLRCGAGEEDLEAMMALAGAQGLFARTVTAPVRDLVPGERLRFARCEATVVCLPGHTPGLSGLSLRPRDAPGPVVFVASDHLLETVSPNPILELSPTGERFRALPTYFESLALLAARCVDWTVPGHGAPFRDHARVIRELHGFYEKRFARTLSRLPAGGASPAELLRAMFPDRGPLETFLMLGEVLGYLDVLEARGRVAAEERGGTLVYRSLA